MSDGLQRLTRHVNQLLSQQTRPLFLTVDARLRLDAVRGHADHFGLGALETGMPMDERLPILASLDPTDTEPQGWRFVQLPDAPVAHVYALRLDDGWGIALLDASAEHAEQQRQQQAAHELLLLRDEREKLLAELEQANQLKSEFIARMSHEFRTPLTSVIGYGEQLREQCSDDATAGRHVAAVVRGGRYLLNLVENLLDQARLEVDRLTLNPGACDLHELSEQVEQLLRPLAEQKQLSLAWWFDSEIPTRVWLDATRLQQVLINLVGNAIKFTRDGGVNVEFGWQHGRLQVAVSDTGPGIDADEQAAIFEPYARASGSGHTKGAGLGLTISRALVQAMGGDIQLSSTAQGARFAFSINADAIQAGGAGSADALAGRRVLLVDDDPDLLELFGLYLQAAGCSVDKARDAEQALTAAQRGAPDVIVLDLNLGDSDGKDVANRLRRAGFKHRLALLSASAGDDTDDGPFDARWRKPIGRAQLLEGIAALMA